MKTNIYGQGKNFYLFMTVILNCSDKKLTLDRDQIVITSKNAKARRDVTMGHDQDIGSKSEIVKFVI